VITGFVNIEAEPEEWKKVLQICHHNILKTLTTEIIKELVAFCYTENIIKEEEQDDIQTKNHSSREKAEKLLSFVRKR